MVEVLIGDLFASSAQTLTNTVNRVGVMGKGIALGFKKRFPEMYSDYVARCNEGRVHLGIPYLFPQLIPPWILNFPTKDHWRSVARLEDIENGLRHLEANYKEWGITSLAVPPLGCGEGQLEWRVVGPTLHRYLSRLDIPVELYAPFGTSSTEMTEEFLIHPVPAGSPWASPSRIRPGIVAVVDILGRIEREEYREPVGRTIFEKIAYFATAAGLATGLDYSRGSFGPHAPGMRGTRTQLVNNGLLNEERRGQAFLLKTGPTYQDALRAYSEAISRAEPLIERVADLFLRIRTPRQAEAAATVHFVTQQLSKELGEIPSEKQVLAEVMRWKQKRRPPLDASTVAMTIRALAVLQWLQVKPSTDIPLPPEEALLEV